MSIYDLIDSGIAFPDLDNDILNNTNELYSINENLKADPLETKIVASDASGSDYFGCSVSTAGDYTVVGANGEDAGGSSAGAAYIYHRTGTNTWDAGIKIVASDAEAGDQFGRSISIDGDYCIVGADGEDTGGSGAGAAYIFHRTGLNSWDTGTKIVASDAEASDYFGYSVSISGDYCVVGAYYEDAGGINSGAAYIFHRTGTNTWDVGTKIVASDAGAYDRFGYNVSIDGDYCIVGTYTESAYIFHRTGTNVWDAGTKIVASDAEAGDNFGYSVSIDGDYCIVGADGEDSVASDAGAAYVFHRTGLNSWDAGIKILASDAEADDNFGFSVSISGDYCIVGANYEDAGGSSAGAAYIFHRSGINTWGVGTKIVASDAEANDRFGFSVSISGDYYIVGAYYENTGGSFAGAAYIYGPIDLTFDVKQMEKDVAENKIIFEKNHEFLMHLVKDNETKIQASDAEADDYFGISASISGDYCIVGAYREDDGGSNSGAAYVFHRTGLNSWDSGIKIVASDAEADDQFGYSVSISGDYCIVGAYGEDDGGSNSGAAYVFHRVGINTWDAGTKIVASDAEADDQFGWSVSIDGDYCIVGATGEDTGGSNSGAAYIFHRTGTNTWDAGTKIVASDAGASDNFGYSASVDGDYCIVGAYGETSNTGAAYIFHRTGTNTWDAGTKIVASDAEASDYFGYSVSISGDYCVVGAFHEDTGASNAGAAYVFHRVGLNTWDAGTKIVASDAEESDLFGNSVSIDGDYVVVGAYREDAGGSSAGAAYIFHRTGDNIWDTGTKIVSSDAEADDYFGYSVSISGDYCVVGAIGETSNAGAAYIYKLP